MEPFIGQITMVGFNYAPQGWALCNGQTLPISQNQALFSLLGTQFGGDGRTNFAVPDLRGRAPMHYGSGPGLTPRQIGQKGGQEQVPLQQSQMPSHTHTLEADTRTGRGGGADKTDPSGHALAVPESAIYSDRSPNAQMSNQAVGSTGGGQPHDNMAPYQVVSFCIALQGVYPPRS